jgi:superfamily II DNA or RNA helicase
VLLGDLERASIDWPSSPASLLPAKRAPHRPRSHQREAVDAIRRGFEDSDRGQLIMACGTGKTLTALFIAETLAATRTLVLVPSLSLLAQTLREWSANATGEFDFIAVCSDESVVSGDDAVATTSELGVPVTTDPAAIAAFLRGRSTRIVFATYQSSPRIADAQRLGRVPRFDLAVADEAHRCAGRVSSDFATVLDPSAIRAERRLFMTATPRYFTGRVIRAAKEADFEVASMDDETTFGPVLHRLSFGEAIDRDLLTDYQVAIIGIDDATVHQWTQERRLVTTDGTNVTDARTLAAQIGLAKAVRTHDLRRTLTFHSRVRSARGFARELPGVIEWIPADQRPDGAIWCDYVSGEMTTGERDLRLGHLRTLDAGERGVLANARCLAEGIDVPTLDGVAFIDPRRSEVDIVQAVGRAIRRAESKKVGTIILPVFVSNTDVVTAALDASTFEPVWDVIKALRAHDADLAEQIDELRRSLGRGAASVTLPKKFVLDLPAHVAPEFADALNVQLVSRVSSSWEQGYGALQEYVATNGSARVERHVRVNGIDVGSFVNNQRTAYRQGALDAERARKLEQVDGWSWHARTTKLQQGITALEAFHQREGHLRVPPKHIEGGYALGTFVTNQRTNYARGQMTPDRIAALEAVPGWEWDPHQANWDTMFGVLQRYITQTGSALVPQDLITDGVQLGTWVSGQRNRHRRGLLDQTRADQLAALPGWSWKPHHDAWDTAYTHLVEYAREHGNCLVPVDATMNGYALGRWVNKQRSALASGRLPEDRTRRLEAVPGWSWNAGEGYWRNGLDVLDRYIARTGTALVPAKHIEGEFKLGVWVSGQRGAYKRGTLDSEKAAQLEERPGWTWELRKRQAPTP